MYHVQCTLITILLYVADIKLAAVMRCGTGPRPRRAQSRAIDDTAQGEALKATPGR